jgi:endonuclease YncB( thermonuclease family)
MNRIALLLTGLLLVAGCAETAPTESTGDAPVEPASVEEGMTDAQPSTAPSERPTPAAQPVPKPKDTSSAGQLAVIASVTDGDTVRLRDGRRIRLVQIDTPEVYGGAECGGRSASSALRQQLPPGTRVRLVADPVSDPVDRYGRELRYVLKGSRNLNLWLVQRGYAAPYFYDGERGRYAAQLERSARAAKARGLGFWGACPNAVLDARRGVSTGRVGGAGSNGASDAASGAAQLQPGRGANLPIAPASGPDLDCSDFSGSVRVTPGDPHRLDRDGDGIGCDA